MLNKSTLKLLLGLLFIASHKDAILIASNVEKKDDFKTESENQAQTRLEKNTNDSSIQDKLFFHIHNKKIDLGSTKIDLANGAHNWISQTNKKILFEIIEKSNKLLCLNLFFSKPQCFIFDQFTIKTIHETNIRLIEAIRKNKSIEKISLSALINCPDFLKVIAPAINQHNTIKSINLANCFLSKEDGLAVSLMLNNKKNIEELAFSFINFGKSLEHIAPGMIANTNLKHLIISHSKLFAKDFLILSDVLMNNSSVTNLTISGLNIADYIFEFSKVIGQNKTLQKLTIKESFLSNLWDSKDRAIEMKELAKAISCHPHIKGLDLQGTTIKLQDFNYFFPTLLSGQNLQYLNCNDICCENQDNWINAMITLVESLKNNKSLLSLAFRPKLINNPSKYFAKSFDRLLSLAYSPFLKNRPQLKIFFDYELLFKALRNFPKQHFFDYRMIDASSFFICNLSLNGPTEYLGLMNSPQVINQLGSLKKTTEGHDSTIVIIDATGFLKPNFELRDILLKRSKGIFEENKMDIGNIRRLYYDFVQNDHSHQSMVTSIAAQIAPGANYRLISDFYFDNYFGCKTQDEMSRKYSSFPKCDVIISASYTVHIANDDPINAFFGTRKAYNDLFVCCYNNKICNNFVTIFAALDSYAQSEGVENKMIIAGNANDLLTARSGRSFNIHRWSKNELKMIQEDIDDLTIRAANRTLYGYGNYVCSAKDVFINGSSCVAPQISGIAALLISFAKESGHNLNPKEAGQILLDSADTSFMAFSDKEKEVNPQNNVLIVYDEKRHDPINNPLDLDYIVQKRLMGNYYTKLIKKEEELTGRIDWQKINLETEGGFDQASMPLPKNDIKEQSFGTITTYAIQFICKINGYSFVIPTVFQKYNLIDHGKGLINGEMAKILLEQRMVIKDKN